VKLIVINGTAESGKDQFIEFVQQNFCFIENISTIDPVKEALECMGWNGDKTDEDRQWMVDTKQRWIQRYNGDACVNWVKDRYDFLKSGEYNYLFVHCREPEEIQKIVDRIPDTITLLVRSQRGKALENGADNVVENYTYDYVIDNDGDLYDFYLKAQDFIKNL